MGPFPVHTHTHTHTPCPCDCPPPPPTSPTVGRVEENSLSPGPLASAGLHSLLAPEGPRGWDRLNPRGQSTAPEWAGPGGPLGVPPLRPPCGLATPGPAPLSYPERWSRPPRQTVKVSTPISSLPSLRALRRSPFSFQTSVKQKNNPEQGVPAWPRALPPTPSLPRSPARSPAPPALSGRFLSVIYFFFFFLRQNRREREQNKAKSNTRLCETFAGKGVGWVGGGQVCVFIRWRLSQGLLPWRLLGKPRQRPTGPAPRVHLRPDRGGTDPWVNVSPGADPLSKAGG